MLKGRIIKGIGGLYFVDVNDEIFECNARGTFRKNKLVPTVGDYVNISVISENKAVIEEILERKNILIRPKVSNIDCVVITFSIFSPDINKDLLDRLLIIAESQNIEKIIICINKCDLINPEQIEQFKKIYSPIYDVVFVSTLHQTGIDILKNLLHNRVTVFCGPSGVGKSSIIKNIVTDIEIKTGEISKKIKRGKHTTRVVELLKVYKNTYIVDSPGFTSLDLNFLNIENFSYYFKEFRNFLGNCKFYDCKHIHEPDCAIKDEIGKTILKERYERYTKLLQELIQKN